MSLRGFQTAAGLIAAVVSFVLPHHRAPINYTEILAVSLPLSALWAALSIRCIKQHGKPGTWMLLGLPLSLFWPAILLLDGIPECYWSSTCRFR